MALKTTADQLLDSLFTDRTGRTGKPLVVAATREMNSAATTTMLTVPKGQVFLITHIVVQSDVNATASTQNASPDANAFGLSIRDAAGTEKWTTYFLSFVRWQQTFEFQNSPNWRNAAPSNINVWKPRFAIPVPEGWTVRAGQTIAGFGNPTAAYGVLVDKGSAETLGYSTSASTTLADHACGVVGDLVPSSAHSIVTGKTGKCIRILDVTIQIQPSTNAANTLTFQQSDGRTIFKFTNNNPGDLFDLKFSPDIYLKAGTDLQTVCTQANTAVVNVNYEFVDLKDVPGDHWWAFVTPDLPTPSVGTTGLLSLFTTNSTQVTLYYPVRESAGDTTYTKTSPTKGMQHILKGYAVSLQKDTSVASVEQVSFNITTGNSAGALQYTAGTLTGSGVALTPTIVAASHDQCVYTVVDRINLPGKTDDGSFWINSANVAVGPATPASGTAQISAWNCTLWGRTIPNMFTDPANLGS